MNTVALEKANNRLLMVSAYELTNIYDYEHDIIERLQKHIAWANYYLDEYSHALKLKHYESYRRAKFMADRHRKLAEEIINEEIVVSANVTIPC